jgi:hypothetical protein
VGTARKLYIVPTEAQAAISVVNLQGTVCRILCHLLLTPESIVFAGNCVGYSVWAAVSVHSAPHPTTTADVPTTHATTTSSTTPEEDSPLSTSFYS